MLSRIQHRVEGAFEASAGLFRKAGLSPNSLTMLGFASTFVVFLLYSDGLRSGLENGSAVLALLLGSFFDALDGAMARRYQLASKIGGVLDSVLDRFGELLLYSGLAIGRLVDVRLALWALAVSFMVSYVRARAESEGISMKGVGIAERPERLLILLASTALHPFYPWALVGGTVIIALLSSVTLVQRVRKIGISVEMDDQR